MENITKYLSRKYIPVWLALILLIASGTGAAVGSVIAGKVTGDISVTTAGSAGGLLIGAPICDTIVHSVDEALEVSGNDVDPVINTWPPGFGFSDITNLDKLAFSDDIYQTTAASALKASQQIYRFYVGDGDNIDKLIVTWEGYGEAIGTLRVFDNTGAVWGMAEPIDTTDSTLTIKITGTTDIDISEAVNSTGYVYVQAYLSAVDNSLFADYVNIAATYSAIDWSNWTGFAGPEIADREFPVPGRCIGVHSDDQTGFEAASELGVGDWWMFILPIKNAGSADIAAELTLDVPGCLNVYIMSADEVGHASPRVTDAVRSGANTWRFLVDADAEKQDDADYLYVMINAHDDCGPGYFTITGTIESVSFSAHLVEPVPVVTGVTSVASIVDGTGTFTEAVYPQSADGNVMLSIPAGTVGLDGGGDPLSEIIIREMASPPPPPADGSIIGLTYTLGPSGATFVPPIRITFNYDPADIPPGVLETNLKLAWWDETISDWVVLANIVVDTVNKTISADVSHFTSFTSLGFEAPTVETSGHTALTAISATLNGNLTDLGDSPNVDLYFEWGTDTTYGNTIAATPASTSTTGAFSTSLSNLSPLTTYHFRAKADGGNHGIVYGADMSFTTPEAVTVVTNAETELTAVSATLNGELTEFNLPAGAAIGVGFELGTTTGYEIVSGAAGLFDTATGVSPFSLAIPGGSLQPDTTYHYRAIAGADFGSGMVLYYGEDVSFTTPDAVEVITNATTDLTAISATLNGEVTSFNLPGGSTIGVGFELGTTTGYELFSGEDGLSGMETGVGLFSLSTIDRMVLLEENTTYHYRAMAALPDTGGGWTFYYGDDMTFTTPTALAVVTNAATDLTGGSATLNGEVTGFNLPDIVPVMVGFELGTTTGYELFNGEDGLSGMVTGVGLFSLSTIDRMVMLDPNTTYHYRAWAAINLGADIIYYYGDDITFTTTNALAVVTHAETDLTAVSATLNGELTEFNLPDGAIVGVGFQIGESTAYDMTISIGGVDLNGIVNVATAAGPFSFSTTGIIQLEPDTGYHYRAVGAVFVGDVGGAMYDLDNWVFYYGDDMSFTTASALVVVTHDETELTAISATMNGGLTEFNLPPGYMVCIGFELGTTTGYEVFSGVDGFMDMATETGTFSSSTMLTMTVLEPNTEYHCRAMGAVYVGEVGGDMDDPDNWAFYYGGDVTFTTPEAVTVVTNAETELTAISATLNGELTEFNLPVGAPVSVGFDLGTDTSYGIFSHPTGIVNMLDGVGPFAGSTSDLGPALNPVTTYHYRAWASIDLSMITGEVWYYYGDDVTFTTSPAS